MNPIRQSRHAATVAAALALCSLAAAQPVFVPLGSLGGGVVQSDAWAVSRDGATVVGGSPNADSSPSDAAFKFVGAGPIGVLAPGSDGMGGFLNDLPGGNYRSTAYGVSADGSVVVGASAYNGVRTHAFRFGPSDTRLTDLGNIAPQTPPLAATSDISVAKAVSDDGTVIVGRGFRQASGQVEACYWLNGAAGATGLGGLAGGTGRSDAHAVSGNGLVIVGEAIGPSGREAFRWSAGGGMSGLGDEPSGAFDSTAYDVSFDGSVIVGYVTSNNGLEAARWLAGSLRALGDLPGGAVDAIATACTRDGTLLVGSGDAGLRDNTFPGFPITSYEAFTWDVRRGFRRIADDLGAALPAGWVLNSANDVTVTATETVVVGSATNPAGDIEAYKAILPRFCVADVNDSGAATVQDIFDFLSAYFSGQALADVNGSGTVTVQDIFDFLAAYFAGC